MSGHNEKEDPLTTSDGQIMVIEGLEDDEDPGFNPGDTTLYRDDSVPLRGDSSGQNSRGAQLRADDPMRASIILNAPKSKDSQDITGPRSTINKQKSVITSMVSSI